MFLSPIHTHPLYGVFLAAPQEAGESRCPWLMTGPGRLASASCSQARVTDNIKAITEAIQATQQGTDPVRGRKAGDPQKPTDTGVLWGLREPRTTAGTHGSLACTLDVQNSESKGSSRHTFVSLCGCYRGQTQGQRTQGHLTEAHTCFFPLHPPASMLSQVCVCQDEA